MKRLIPTALLMVLATLPLSGCGEDSTQSDVAVSNSLLECAVKDLLGDQAPVLRLAEPGMCPGHFDVRPSQISQLRNSRLLLRMDFQDSLDSKLSGATADGLKIAEVSLDGGLSSPPTYVEACRQTADALVSSGLLDRSAADERLRRISERMDALSSRVKDATVSLQDIPVIASVHQKAFCEWLGLRVVGTFRGADVEVTRHLQQAYEAGRDAGAEMIIANRPEGRKAADFLAERLGAKVAVFDNFPMLGGRHADFDDLVEDNVGRLLEAGEK